HWLGLLPGAGATATGRPAFGAPDTPPAANITNSMVTGTTTRAGRRAHSAIATSSTAVSNRPQRRQVGQGSTPTVTRAEYRATTTNHRQGHAAIQANAWAIPGETGETAVAPNPSTIAGSNTGAASMLAGIAETPTMPNVAATTGAQAS